MRLVGVKNASHHPTSPFFLLPWAIERQLGVGIWEDSFIPQWVSASICVAAPSHLHADTSLPVQSKSYSWPHHLPAACPLWSSLSTSVNGDTNSSYLQGELEKGWLNSYSTSQTCLTTFRNKKHIFTLWCSLERLFSGVNYGIALSLSFPICNMERITVPPS